MENVLCVLFFSLSFVSDSCAQSIQCCVCVGYWAYECLHVYSMCCMDIFVYSVKNIEIECYYVSALRVTFATIGM